MIDPTDPFASPLATDVTTIKGQLVAVVQAINPNFKAVGTLDDVLSAAATIAAETRTNFNDRLRSEVLTLVGDVFAAPRSLGAPARGTMTVKSLDSLAHADIAEGDLVYVGDLQCRTTSALVLANGQNTGTVGIETVEPGAEFNGAFTTDQLEVAPYKWIDTVTLNAPLSGGLDAPDDLTYSRQFHEDAQTFSRAVLQPSDAVQRARRNAEVGWAYTIKDWDPTANGGSGAAAVRVRTLVIAKTDGTQVSSAARAAVQADIDALTVGNWLWYVVHPTYVDVDITATITADPGWEAVAAPNAQAALSTRVSPGPWMMPRYGLDPGYAPPRKIHDSVLIAAAKQADGVGTVPTLTIGNGSSRELVLTVPTQLPRARTITVSRVT